MKQKKLLAFLFLLNFIGIIIATLWPFDFSPSNGATWIPGRNGIHFSKHGVLVSTSPLAIPSSIANNSVTVELWLRSDEIWSSRTAVGIYNPDRGAPFLIRQWNGGLFVSRDSRGSPGITTGDRIYTKRLFHRGVPILLTIASSPSGTIVYANAEQMQSFPTFRIRPGDFSGQIVLGTAPNSFTPWRGDIYLVSVYASALSPEEIRMHYDSISKSPLPSRDSGLLLAQYSFNECTGAIVHSSLSGAPDLQIPKTFFLPYKPVLQSPWADYETTWAYYYDGLVNVLGFLPFGFLLCAWLAHTRLVRFAVLCSFLSGALFSFLIEFIQGYIPQRDSGFNDVITNSIGALLGALFAGLILRKQR